MWLNSFEAMSWHCFRPFFDDLVLLGLPTSSVEAKKFCMGHLRMLSEHMAVFLSVRQRGERHC